MTNGCLKSILKRITVSRRCEKGEKESRRVRAGERGSRRERARELSISVRVDLLGAEVHEENIYLHELAKRGGQNDDLLKSQQIPHGFKVSMWHILCEASDSNFSLLPRVIQMSVSAEYQQFHRVVVYCLLAWHLMCYYSVLSPFLLMQSHAT